MQSLFYFFQAFLCIFICNTFAFRYQPLCPGRVGCLGNHLPPAPPSYIRDIPLTYAQPSVPTNFGQRIPSRRVRRDTAAPGYAPPPQYAPHPPYHAPRVGPVYTFVKTDPQANFKWGVRHRAGAQYGR